VSEIAILEDYEIVEHIYRVRGKKVMLDRDLANLYGVETEQLTRQVRRNIDRFPDDFMLILTRQEVRNLIHQFGGSRWGGNRKPPVRLYRTWDSHAIECVKK